MKTEPTILIIGAGAVGGIIAAILKKKGHKVSLVVNHADYGQKISEDGLEVSGVRGAFKICIPTISIITEIEKKPDIVLIATKAPAMPQVAKDILPLLNDESLVVSLQNGIVEEELANIVGEERTVGCVVGWGATMHSQGVLEMTSMGEFVIGYLNKASDDKLKGLAKVLSDILPVEISDNILLSLYSKLIINSCISTVGAICGLTLGKMLSQKLYRDIFLDIIREAMQVADSLNWKIPDYAGKLNYYKLLKWPKFRQHLFLRAFGFKYRKLRSSSLQSLERGRKTEVHYFNGYISAKGKSTDTPTPINDLLVHLIDEIENGKREISIENLRTL